ncbi:hypothetical protein LHK_01021 [Laribacter hongkongensis HLHK9]|uniref:Uncharacterized protein n=1 Tax=Laribacter hongkongensis (strain HLHK9) TaxID=557598 RepID=C1D5Y2_LARHH|nr:hypothetical protein LHK_01021 [Laribacter hongkongensis HLHK9]
MTTTRVSAMEVMLAEHSNISFEEIFIYYHHFLITVADLKIINSYTIGLICI